MSQDPPSSDPLMDISGEAVSENDMASVLGPQELRTVFDSIPAGVCVLRDSGEQIEFLFCNTTFYEILGYSKENIAKARHERGLIGMHPEDIPKLREKWIRLVGLGEGLHDTFRVFHDRKQEYRWIQMEGSVNPQDDGNRILCGVFRDVSEQRLLEEELAGAYDKMEDIINAIPGGVAIYKVSDMFETVYFSDGVSELTGYSVEEYQELIKRDAAELIYWEDTDMVMEQAREAVRTHETIELEFRKQHRDGHIVWVRAQVKWIGEENGCPLLHCVFHNISDFRQAQIEMNHLINSIPGGIASYRVEKGYFVPTFFSDGVAALSGHSRSEYAEMVRHDVMDIIYEPDRGRVMSAAQAAVLSGEVLDVSYRMCHKNGSLVWIHLNGRRIGPLAEVTRFYAVFTGMSDETRLFQNLANETADGIYVIDQKNYDLLYVNESDNLFMGEENCIGKKCYEALHKQKSPCEFCTLKSHKADGEEHEMVVNGADRFFSTRFRETDWNGIPAYVKYVRDVTEEVKNRREKKKLEEYFQTVVKNLPGGVAVIRYQKDGSMTPEFLSDGFAAMTGMCLEEAWELYNEDAMIGVHPQDKRHVNGQIAAYIASGENHCEIVYRLKKNGGEYLWVKNTLSLIQNEGGEGRVYAVYQDMTKEREEQDLIRQQYKDLIMQHYRTPDPNSLIIGHCNITQNVILEISDQTDSDLLKNFGTVREEFFTALGSLVVDEQERRTFLDMYLNEPALAAFRRNETERILKCFIKLPKEEKGRYVQFKVNLVETPDTGDITGILTVTDITDQAVSDLVLHQLSITNHDFVIDLDLDRDRYIVLTGNQHSDTIPQRGCHSQWTDHMVAHVVVPKDRKEYANALNADEIRRRLSKDKSYTVTYSITDKNGDIRTKNMTVFPIDMRLGRVCLVRTDITDSVREQQGLLNMMAYTFEVMGFINIHSNLLTMHTRQTVLENLSPYITENYNEVIDEIIMPYESENGKDEVRRQFSLNTMLERLKKKPEGYDFVFGYQTGEELRYKQTIVLWGDENHRTICMVRADVTDMLAAERQSKKTLEEALALAREASQAKSDFLSAMSHDIRTPMNAIMGMTTLASAYIDDRDRVKDYLNKISISSKHLLSLINDILDMSKIETSKITLNHLRITLPELLEQLMAIMQPQAKECGVYLNMGLGDISHNLFYGDYLRINQILINLLGNAVKFTPEGGTVDFQIDEIPHVNGGERVRYRFMVKDTGIGMSEEFLSHLFEPFSRSRAAAHIEGTGLGLSITKGLVTLMGGDISVESQVNYGSSFQVELEFETAEAENEGAIEESGAKASAAERKKMFAGRCFLVAEDNSINAEILRELLKMHGADSVIKSDGIQAVEEFRGSAPKTYDAILMDIQMPEMNGYEASQAIRNMEREDAKTIPIIAMTANAFAEDVQTALEAGMTAHVAKPIDLDVLRMTLQKSLKGL